jgi:hypothetical protein
MAWGSGSPHGSGFGACAFWAGHAVRSVIGSIWDTKVFALFYGHEELTGWHFNDATALNDNAIAPGDAQVFFRCDVLYKCGPRISTTCYTLR